MKRILSISMVALALVGCSRPAPTKPASPKPSPTPSTSSAEPDTAPTTETNAVSIKGFAFAPASITVKAGTAATWTNNDSFAHTVTSVGGSPASFDSQSLGAGKSFSFTFEKPGTYRYVCDFHGQMTGAVVVE